MRRRLEYLRPTILVLVAMFLGLLGGVVLDREVLAVFAQPPTDLQTGEFDSALIEQAWGIINRSYVDRPAVKPRELTYAAISGMTDALGDTGHSRFMTPEIVKQEGNFTRGSFEGIGAQVESRDGHTVIVAPMDDSPAQKAGLKAGDIILAVNGEIIDGQPISQVVAKVSGPAGTDVTLTIQDPKSGTQRDVTIVRARISLHNVSWTMVPESTVAHIRIGAFSQGITQELKNAIANAKDHGATGIVLDLRNNPGGLLDEAVGTASQFLRAGDVLQEKDAKGQIIKVGVKSGGVALDIPVVVLINNGTASAAEIVAGALQDANRARLIGGRTFGTGTVLNQFALADGSALLIATEEWLTPAGRVIWHKGIMPDVLVDIPNTTTLLTPESEKQLTRAQLETSGDAQLLKGLELLGVMQAKP